MSQLRGESAEKHGTARRGRELAAKLQLSLFLVYYCCACACCPPPGESMVDVSMALLGWLLIVVVAKCQPTDCLGSVGLQT